MALSTEILTLANSALYAFRTEIRASSRPQCFWDNRRYEGLPHRFNEDSGALNLACCRHSLACALLAEELAVGNFVDKDSAYTAALIHDIGRLALAVIQPAKYADLLKSTEEEPCDVLKRERELFEIDHCQAGCWLVEAWKLPRTFVDVTAHHHSKPENRTSDMVVLVRHACLLADALGFAAARSLESPSYQEVLEELSERERRRFCQSPEELSLKIATKINSME